MKKYVIFIIFLMISALLGCASDKKNEDKKEYSYYVYYLNSDNSELVKEGIETKEIEQLSDNLGKINYLIEKMQNPKDISKEHPVLNKDVKILSYDIKNRQLSLNFSFEYQILSSDIEVLYRAAIVKTFIQLDFIDKIIFMVNGGPLVDSNGNTISIMDNNSFVENMGTDIKTYKEEMFDLYFSDNDYKKLIKTEVKTRIRPNIPKEKLILELLSKGPNKEFSDMVKPTIPAELKINSIVTKNEVCYIDFSIKNVSTENAVSGPLTIYSMVNSITDGSNILKVKFSIDSNDTATYRGVKLDEAFEKNYKILE